MRAAFVKFDTRYRVLFRSPLVPYRVLPSYFLFVAVPAPLSAAAVVHYLVLPSFPSKMMSLAVVRLKGMAFFVRFGSDWPTVLRLY